MRIILFSLLILSSLNSFSTKITSISSGDWSQSSTWDLNRTPSCEDTIVIDASQKPGFNMERLREAWKGQTEIH